MAAKSVFVLYAFREDTAERACVFELSKREVDVFNPPRALVAVCYAYLRDAACHRLDNDTAERIAQRAWRGVEVMNDELHEGESVFVDLKIACNHISRQFC